MRNLWKCEKWAVTHYLPGPSSSALHEASVSSLVCDQSSFYQCPFNLAWWSSKLERINRIILHSWSIFNQVNGVENNLSGVATHMRQFCIWLMVQGKLHKISPHVTDGTMTLVSLEALFARKYGLTKYFRWAVLHGHLGHISRGTLQSSPLVGNFYFYANEKVNLRFWKLGTRSNS